MQRIFHRHRSGLQWRNRTCCRACRYVCVAGYIRTDEWELRVSQFWTHFGATPMRERAGVLIVGTASLEESGYIDLIIGPRPRNDIRAHAILRTVLVKKGRRRYLFSILSYWLCVSLTSAESGRPGTRNSQFYVAGYAGNRPRYSAKPVLPGGRKSYCSKRRYAIAETPAPGERISRAAYATRKER